MSGYQAPGIPTALRVRQMKGEKKARVWAGVKNRSEWGQITMEWPARHETGVGSAVHQGNCLVYPFSKLERCRSLGAESGAREERKVFKPRRHPQRRQNCRPKGRGRGNRRWEAPEEGRGLRGSTQRSVAKLREGGLPFSPEGSECICREGE